nr:tetratricopeptide repeat protein [Bacillus subtilis]
MRQTFFSLNHAEKALQSFKAHENYTNRVIKCTMLFAMNKVDLQQWEEALSLYKHAIHIAVQTNDGHSEGLGHFNLGVCYERQERLEEAKESFIKALTVPAHCESVYSIRSMYMLSRVFYKLGSIESAREWRTKALAYANKVNEEVYIAKLNFIYFLYDETNQESIEAQIAILKARNLWDDVADLCVMPLFTSKSRITPNCHLNILKKLAQLKIKYYSLRRRYHEKTYCLNYRCHSWIASFLHADTISEQQKTVGLE